MCIGWPDAQPLQFSGTRDLRPELKATAFNHFDLNVMYHFDRITRENAYESLRCHKSRKRLLGG